MKIALVVAQFPSPEHPYIFDWVKELIKKGIDLTIITEKGNKLPASDFWEPGQEIWTHVRYMNQINRPNFVLVFRSLFISLLHPSKLFFLIKILRKSEENKPLSIFRKCFEYLPLLNEEFDIIHFNAPQIAIRRFELTEYFKAKSLVSFRGQDFSFYPDRYKSLLVNTDHLHFISNHLVKLAMENGYAGGKHTIIPPMVDISFYYPGPEKPASEHKPYFLFTAARLEWMKGYEFALQAVALLLKRGMDLEYYIAGDGGMKDAIIFTIHQLGIQDHVHLLGWQTPEAIREWMQKSDLFVLGSVNEAFNNSALQAQACGLPVVCSDEGGLPENIEDGVTGFLFRKRDAWDMAEKIELIISNPELLRIFRENSIDRATNLFTLNCQQYLNLYNKIIKY